MGILGWRSDHHCRSTVIKIEIDLMKLLPKKEWAPFSHVVIFHGRRICAAFRPDCAACPVNPLCPKRGVTAAR